MQIIDLAWYCARTKPKHEHIAAANVRRNLGLEVFHPRLRIERATRRGMVRVVEPLFPCYIFVRCAIEKTLNEIRYSNGISSIVHFADRIPTVEDSGIEESPLLFFNGGRTNHSRRAARARRGRFFWPRGLLWECKRLSCE